MFEYSTLLISSDLIIVSLVKREEIIATATPINMNKTNKTEVNLAKILPELAPKNDWLDPPRAPIPPPDLSSCNKILAIIKIQINIKIPIRIKINTLIIVLYLLKFTIFVKESTFKEAPPTNAPSIFGFDIKPATFSAVTDPPYCIISLSAISLL